MTTRAASDDFLAQKRLAPGGASRGARLLRAYRGLRRVFGRMPA